MKKINRALTQAEKEYLKNLGTVTAKLAYRELVEAAALHDVSNKYIVVNLLEKQLKEKWKQVTLRAMADKRFPKGDALDFYNDLAGNYSISVMDRLESKCKKILAVYPEKGTDKDRENYKWVSVFHGLLGAHHEKINAFNKYAYKMLNSGKCIAKVMDEAQKRDAREEIDFENRLYCTQTLKHIKQLRKKFIVPSYAKLKTALDANFSDDAELYQEQSLCVQGTYNEALTEKDRVRVKNLCYNFVAKAFKVAKRPHPFLIAFLLEGDWISEKTFNLLMESYDIISKDGMCSLVEYPIAAMLKKRVKVSEKDKTDEYLETLFAKYSKR